MKVCATILELFHESKQNWTDRVILIGAPQGYEHMQKWNVRTKYCIRCIFMLL
jgi:hypothetical protein